MFREAIHTDEAPAAIGTYSQAVRVGDTIYLSGQIALDPASMELVSDDPEAQVRQVLDNLSAVARAGGGSFADVVRLTVYLT
ncbi:MAG: Rid family hydrolase, partial [Gammaproteobacteria bacterium]|nr:Rid family hydrolase [Gammaproteobacteria bacterium]